MEREAGCQRPRPGARWERFCWPAEIPALLLLPWDLGHVTEFLNAPVSCSVKWGHNSAWPLGSLWGFQYSYLSP